MDLYPLESSKLLALMVAGGAFALAGLWLMYMLRRRGGSAKLEVMGIKFESSSTGLLVFLIGAAFLATPLFVEENLSGLSDSDDSNIMTAASGLRSGRGNGDADSSDARPIGNDEGDTAAVVLPPSARGREEEPNDLLTEANWIERAVAYSGETNPDRDDDVEDWFLLPSNGLTNSEVLLQVWTRKGWIPSLCLVSLFDDQQRKLDSLRLASEGTSKVISALLPATKFLLIRVHSQLGVACEYELKVL